jgi:hypothetical protein
MSVDKNSYSIVGVPENIQGTIQKILFVTFLKKGNAKNFYM